MTLMPKSGRVLVIDDQIYEAYPIMRVLSKKGVKYSFFSGNVKEIPNERFYDIRLVFLDLYLQGDSRTQSFDLINSTFKGIFDKSNSPIIIILWTANQGDFYDFCKFYGEKIHFPEIVAIVPLNKEDYFEYDESGDYVPKRNEDVVYSELIEKILQTIPNNHWFHVHTLWDNIANEASLKSLNTFLTIFPHDREIDKKMWSLILSLALANSGDNVNVRDKNDVIKNALNTFNMVFLDEIENLILHINYDYSIPDLTKTEIINDTVAVKIHDKIHFAHGDKDVSPGSIIIQTDDNLKSELLQEHLIKGSLTEQFMDIWSSSKCIICEISPRCDCFSNKWKKHRVVYGLIFKTKFEKKFKPDGQYSHTLLPFEMDHESYCIRLDFRYLDAFPLDYFNDDLPIMRLRQDLLSEIQIKCSAHVNRTGVISITPKEFKKFLKKYETN